MNYKTIEYKGIGSTGFVAEYSNRQSAVDGITSIDFTNHHSYQLKLGLGKYVMINKATLKIVSAYNNPTIFVRQKESLTASGGELLCSGFCNSDGVYELDITELFAEDTNGHKFISIASKTAMHFYTHDTPDECKPMLIVEYFDLQTTLSKEQRIPLNVGEGISSAVDVRSGVVHLTKELLSFGGEHMPLNLTAIYNGASSDTVIFNGMPKGWKFNYHQKVVKTGNTFVYRYHKR